MEGKNHEDDFYPFLKWDKLVFLAHSLSYTFFGGRGGGVGSFSKVKKQLGFLLARNVALSSRSFVSFPADL